MPDGPDLTLFQKILLATDGTVTDLIALYAGEPIRVIKLEQTIRDAASDAQLGCAEPTRVLERKVLLSGAVTTYLYAESRFVLHRLSDVMREQLLNTDCPIGLLWKEERLETFREIVEQKTGPCAPIAHHFGLPESAGFLSRTYLVHHAGKPLGVVTETWPLSSFR